MLNKTRLLCLVVAVVVAAPATMRVALASNELQLEKLTQLISTPYPECCSARHVSELMFVESGLTVYLTIDQNEEVANGPQVKADAIRRFSQYLPLLSAYCTKMLTMKLSKRENFQLFQDSYKQVNEITDELNDTHRELDVEDIPEGRFLAEFDQYLTARAAEKSCDKREALAEVKEAANKLTRLINLDISPVLLLEMGANAMAAHSDDQQVSPELTRNWAATFEKCSKIRLTRMNEAGKLELKEFLTEEEEDEEDGSDAKSPLLPLNLSMVRLVTKEEGYLNQFHMLAHGIEPVPNTA